MKADPDVLYRLPWTLSDNILAWLIPTRNCTLHCPGCFSTNASGSHKSLEEIQAYIDRLRRRQKSDVLGIGGGEPLTHPGLEKVVEYSSRKGYKPIVMTNGIAMTPARMANLKAAGMKGVYFHVDSLMDRPGWEGATEAELNELRAFYAGMTAEAGGLTCYLSATIADSNADQVPGMLEWARDHADTVHMMQFINFRRPDASHSAGALPGETSIDDLLSQARSSEPGFSPCAYVDGGKDNAVRWLISLRAAVGGETFGYFGPRFAESLQIFSHLLRGKYLAPGASRNGRTALLASLFERNSREAALAYAGSCLRNPRNVVKPINIQTVLFVQPNTLTQDGGLDFFL